MRPWGGKGRAEAAEKAEEKVQGHEAVGAMGHGTNEARSAMGREGRRGGNHMGGKGGGLGRAGMHWDPLKSAERVPWEPWGGMGPWSHGAMSH